MRPPVRSASITLVLSLICILCAFCQTGESESQGKTLPAGENLLWSDPGDVAALDLIDGFGGAGNRPAPPFQFESEDMSGTNPKVKVKDSKGHTWSVKFGEEVKPSVFATRLLWACGYFVETEYYVSYGRLEGVKDLKRARSAIQKDGTFTDARFQLRAPWPKYLDGSNWSWTSNPFLGTSQLNGLKILVMLVSNWDTKDARDKDSSSHSAYADSNLAIFQSAGPPNPRYEYMMSDWGASFGKWGTAPGTRNKFRCLDYQAQSADFVKGVDNDVVRWGYSGKHNDDITQNIHVSDVRWLLQYLGKVTDNQLRRGLAGSGATPDEIDCYVGSIRERIGQLQRIASL
ncbi:MAG: hypothetical protein JO022_18805 [Acidobacteriaceae bacterium]|nr:hypothetical protein [Acidobacteriaceae bacterium]